MFTSSLEVFLYNTISSVAVIIIILQYLLMVMKIKTSFQKFREQGKQVKSTRLNSDYF